MKLKVNLTFFFFRNHAGQVTRGGKNDQLFPLEALWPSFFWLRTTLPGTHSPAPYWGIGRLITFFFLN